MSKSFCKVRVSDIPFNTNAVVFTGVDYSVPYFRKPSKRCVPMFPLVHFISDKRDDYVFQYGFRCAQIVFKSSDFVYTYDTKRM